MLKGKKQFFFEKKNQKTFMSLAYAAGMARDSDAKVFCFFSSEKKALLRRDHMAGMRKRATTAMLNLKV